MQNEKYELLRKFFKENFETSTNINDRLHTRDIVNIVYDNKLLSYSDCKIAIVFKEMNLGEHRNRCNINRKVHSGYYFLIYKGNSQKRI
jgi:hypothetical protein